MGDLPSTRGLANIYQTRLRLDCGDMRVCLHWCCSMMEDTVRNIISAKPTHRTLRTNGKGKQTVAASSQKAGGRRGIHQYAPDLARECMVGEPVRDGRAEPSLRDQKHKRERGQILEDIRLCKKETQKSTCQEGEAQRQSRTACSTTASEQRPRPHSQEGTSQRYPQRADDDCGRQARRGPSARCYKRLPREGL